MHIAFITYEYPSSKKPEGGLGNYIQKVSLELINRGHFVTIYILNKDKTIDSNQKINFHFIKPIKFHWRFHKIDALQPWFTILEQFINAIKARNVINKTKKINLIDILQTPNYKTPGIYLSNNQQFPIVCRCSSYQPLLRKANGIKNKVAHTIEDWLELKQVSSVDAVFSPSMLISRVYENQIGIKPVVLRSPIETNLVDDDLSFYNKVGKGRKYLLFFGSMNGIKGIDILFEVIPKVLEKNKDLCFLLIGRNDTLPTGIKAFKFLEIKLGKFIDEKRLIYSHQLPKDVLYPVIKNAYGVVLPSRVDNYPNACLEAFSFGIPVIGTYDSSLDEIIEDGKTGLLAKNGDPISLYDVIEKFLDQSPEEYSLMVENIHKRVYEISKEDRVGQLVEFYEFVISNFSKRISK